MHVFMPAVYKDFEHNTTKFCRYTIDVLSYTVKLQQVWQQLRESFQQFHNTRKKCKQYASFE